MVRYKKYVLGLLGIFFLVLLILFFAPKARSWYWAWKDARFQERVQSVRKEIYDATMADTYGGKTPQETLQMYISAVEKGDYELASKYFVEKEREKELKSLLNSPVENVQNSNALLKESLVSSGSFSDDRQWYVIRKPLLVEFVLYPNDIWKIIEI